MALPNMQKTVRKQEGISEKIKNTRLKIKDLIIPIIVSMILLFISCCFYSMLKKPLIIELNLKR